MGEGPGPHSRTSGVLAKALHSRKSYPQLMVGDSHVDVGKSHWGMETKLPPKADTDRWSQDQELGGAVYTSQCPHLLGSLCSHRRQGLHLREQSPPCQIWAKGNCTVVEGGRAGLGRWPIPCPQVGDPQAWPRKGQIPVLRAAKYTQHSRPDLTPLLFRSSACSVVVIFGGPILSSSQVLSA
jgi:hypothetical protein